MSSSFIGALSGTDNQENLRGMLIFTMPAPPEPVPNITFEYKIKDDQLILKHVVSDWVLDLQKVS